MTSEPAPKAWRVVWSGLPESAGIYIAESAGIARAMAYRTLGEVGYPVRFHELACHRAQEYDAWAVKQSGHRLAVGTLEEYVKREATAFSGS